MAKLILGPDYHLGGGSHLPGPRVEAGASAGGQHWRESQDCDPQEPDSDRDR